MNSLWIAYILCSLLIQGISSSSFRENQDRNLNSGYSASNYNDRYRYNVDSNLTPISSKTEYGFQTVQKGTAYIPPGQKGPAIIKPEDQKTQYYFVTTNKTSYYIPKKFDRYANNRTRLYRLHHRRSPPDCIKCPSERILIAQRGLDGVLAEPPKLYSCQNRPISNDIYQVETLFGPEYNFLLSHGSHSFHGKIRNKRNGKHLQTCVLRYKVVVQQCGRFYPRDTNLKTKCDLGYIWGSKCYFTCRIGFLSHNRPVICGDSLQWEGDEPQCLPAPPTNNRRGACSFLSGPDNGRFACEYPKGTSSKDYENELVTPEGTICRVMCDTNYEIPSYLEPYSALRCQNGQWNSTFYNLCYPQNRERHVFNKYE